MSDKKMLERSDQNPIDKAAHGATQPIRRRLLKGTVAIPVIMTLHSGAALARTSNLVGAVNSVEEAAKIVNDLEQEQVVCAMPDLLEDQSLAPPYDLGEAPQAFLADEGGATDPCAPDGIMISATAFTSLQAKGLTIE
ncbi:MAG: hypothetical protein R6W74_05070 [Nitrosomonas halophila]